MLLGMILALMTGAAVMAVLIPLSRAVAPDAAEAGEVKFYRDQLDSIAADERIGLIGSPEAEAARTEAGRRLLRAEAYKPSSIASASEPALRRRRAAAAIALSVVPIVSLAFYGALGSPQRPGMPLASRLESDPRLQVATALARMDTHLTEHPEDGQGWALVAPIYLRAGRFDEAEQAYKSALHLLGDDPGRLAGYGEAIVGVAGGVVSADARIMFERALALDPDNLRPRYYMALAAEQDGDARRAADLYRSVLASAVADAPWAPLVRARLARLEPAASTEPPPPEMQAAVQGMVDSLDTRLRSQGGSEPEWARLVRSFVVLGHRDTAAARLGQARVALASDSGALTRLDGLARDLGIAETSR